MSFVGAAFYRFAWDELIYRAALKLAPNDPEVRHASAACAQFMSLIADRVQPRCHPRVE